MDSLKAAANAPGRRGHPQAQCAQPQQAQPGTEAGRCADLIVNQQFHALHNGLRCDSFGNSANS